MTTLQHQYLSVDVILIDPVQSCSSSTTGTTTAIESRPELPHSSARPTSAPELIVLFAWMDAQLKHVVKYSDHYAAIVRASPLLYRFRSSLNRPFRSISRMTVSFGVDPHHPIATVAVLLLEIFAAQGHAARLRLHCSTFS